MGVADSVDRGAYRMFGREIEGARRGGADLSDDGAFAVDLVPEIEDGDGELDFLIDDLNGFALVEDVASPQDLVASDEFVERGDQGFRLELALDRETKGKVVRRSPGLELLEKPESLLGEGERRVSRSVTGADRSRRGRTRTMLSRGQGREDLGLPILDLLAEFSVQRTFGPKSPQAVALGLEADAETEELSEQAVDVFGLAHEKRTSVRHRGANQREHDRISLSVRSSARAKSRRNTNMQTLGAGALARTEMFGRLETRLNAETPRTGLVGDV